MAPSSRDGQLVFLPVVKVEHYFPLSFLQLLVAFTQGKNDTSYTCEWLGNVLLAVKKKSLLISCLKALLQEYRKKTCECISAPDPLSWEMVSIRLSSDKQT